MRKSSIACRYIAASLLCCLLAFMQASAISFDSTFASGGKFMTVFGDVPLSGSGGRNVFIQPSGRIVAVGTHYQRVNNVNVSGLAFVGLTGGGTLDSTFGNAGKLLLWDSTFQRFFNNVEMLPDGSFLIFIQRYESVSATRPAIVKVSASGQPDATFDPNLTIEPNHTHAVLMALSSSGKIYALVRNQFSVHSLIRLNADGSRDTTYGPDGVRELNLERFPFRQITYFSEATDGKLWIVGYGPGPDNYTAFMVRVDGNANFDRSFGNQGVVRLLITGGGVYGNTLKLLSDGRLLVGGSWGFLGSNTLLMRLMPRGRPDTGFGSGGGYTMSSYRDLNSISEIALAPDGKLIVAGTCGDKAFPSNRAFLVMTVSQTGVRESFLTDRFVPNREAGLSDIVMQPDGKVLVAGFTQNLTNDDTQLVVARFNP